MAIFALVSRYNCENGGPAPEKLTNAIYQNTTKIKEYWIAEERLSVDLDKLGTTQFMVQHQDGKFGPFAVEVQPCSTPVGHRCSLVCPLFRLMFTLASQASLSPMAASHPAMHPKCCKPLNAQKVKADLCGR